jgi:hypothetical protein
MVVTPRGWEISFERYIFGVKAIIINPDCVATDKGGLL